METVKVILLCATLPGGGGGLGWFLCGLRKGWIKNNKCMRKGGLEVAGGMLVASFLGYPLSALFNGLTPLVVVCFAIGTCWSVIIQVLRQWITVRINSLLNGEGK